ncbi:hypothetical protein NMY22_g7047 [Coprinellus aureogranulatus]|nr:hypothetical protein NMY22_g7047 [Coprinellus aureogranulatus]
MLATILQALAVALSGWVCWRLLKPFVFKHPLARIPGPPPESLLTGNLQQMFSLDCFGYHTKLAGTYGPVYNVPGILQEQNVFEESEDFLLSNKRTLGMGLLATLGDHHRKQRKMLNPVFSIAHMREMTPTFYGIGRQLQASFKELVSSGEQEIEMYSWITRTALELIGQSGYGYSFDTLKLDAVEHRYAKALKRFIILLGDLPMTMARLAFYPLIDSLFSPQTQRLLMGMLPWKNLHELRDVCDLMHETSVEIFDAAKKALEDGGGASSRRVGNGKDIMSILLRANMEAEEQDRLPEHELLAQITTLTFAATDTTSNSLSRIIHLLAENPQIQEKLRHELVEAYEGREELDYETLSNLPYLEAVCRESLRLHTPLPYLAREARQDSVLPLSQPIKTAKGEELESIFIPKDSKLLISMHGCNLDPAIWGPDAHEWKPERWLQPLPQSVSDAKVPGIYSNLMTFLGGSRACIGFKFAQLEMKVILSLLIRSFHFSPPEDKKIVWQYSGLVQPTTEDAPLTENGKKILQLPLRVRLVSKP